MSVVGRDAGTAVTTVDQPKVSAETAKALSGLMARINAKNGTGGIVLDPGTLGGLSLVDTLTGAQATAIGKILKKRGKSVDNSKSDIQRLLTTDPSLSVLVQNSASYQDLVDNLVADYLPGLDTTGPEAFKGPSRSIYKYTDEDVDTLIHSVYKEKLMRPATPEELAATRKKTKSQLEIGTLSTTKVQKNPKTGKMEQVTVQEAGPTKEVISQNIGTELEKLNPDEIDRTARIGFSSWLSQNVQGA